MEISMVTCGHKVRHKRKTLFRGVIMHWKNKSHHSNSSVNCLRSWSSQGHSPIFKRMFSNMNRKPKTWVILSSIATVFSDEYL